MTWLQFKQAVKVLLSNVTVGDDVAVRAVAFYVRMQIAREFLNDQPAYSTLKSTYENLREQLLGYTIVMNQTTLRSRVRELLTDDSINDTTGEKAVAEYVLAMLCRDWFGDQAGAQAHLAAYQQQRARLLGYTISISGATLRTAINLLISDLARNDTDAIRAVAYYTEATLLRKSKDTEGTTTATGQKVLTQNEQNFQFLWTQWLAHRRRMAGYTYTGNSAALQTAVKVLLTDDTPDDTMGIGAVALWVKAKISLEVNNDPVAHGVLMGQYDDQRTKLLGYVITVNAAAVRAAINPLITVDSTRGGISAPNEFIDQQIALCIDDMEGYAALVNATILQGNNELIGINNYIDATIVQATTEIAGFATWVNANIDQANIDIQGPRPQLDATITQGAIDLEQFIEVYKEGHENVYQADDLTIEGSCSVGALPAGAQIQDIYVATTGTPCIRAPYVQYDWENRFDLICGNPRIYNCNKFIAIDPQAKTFMAYPVVRNDQYVSLFWNGLKETFADGDEVPFGQKAAEAIADYTLREIYAKPPRSDRLLSQKFDISYRGKRRLLFAEKRAEGRINFSKQSQMPRTGSCQTCFSAVPDDTDIEVVLFGDSGEAPLDNTLAVATLVKDLDPDMVIHLGDTNYPDGDPITQTDNFQNPYRMFIAEKMRIVWGNHDLTEAEGGQYGKYLLDLFPAIAAMNSGKLYYQFVLGQVQFFVINSGFSDADPREPDGILFNQVQGVWLQAALSGSSSVWKVVLWHRPPWTSDVNYTPGSPVMQAWPLKTWGADLLMSGHGHNYERFLVDQFPSLVAGLGGATKRAFGAVANGSQFRYTDAYGVLKLTANSTTLQVSFINTDKTTVDRLMLTK